ncbi:L,D-transpeptidase family protein [Amantichitinum ursilacus]|uniref:L,D-transpeptidase catalytic domain n=1 Tax=Amantichitinum ursilacus TaxID=857265 RepID=A0A0N0XMM4_9NEIS|nr:L,D-transpeptidase family protein [Amantichitinum ursilacus]KPC54825.1 L,D-transpeptidase catalytic domain [Amantichitinum ursilacus]
MTRTLHWGKLAVSLLALLLLAPSAQPRMSVTPLYQQHPLLDPVGKATDGSPERMIVAAIDAIRAGRMGDARATVDALIAKEPNYRLAWLLSADLYAMRSIPLDNIGGGVAHAPADRLDDLRREALARLKRQDNPPPASQVPAEVLAFSKNQKFAIVVDASASRLFLFENNNGVPRYVSDSYVTVGKLGTEKLREGDQRTPLGVYFVYNHMTRPQLDKTFGAQADLYGVGAWPISYPNEMDRREGRTGHGIWLHGSPSDTYARPPQASNGCVVLTNPDMLQLADHLQIGATPVVIVPQMHWLSLPQWQQRRDQMQTLVENWRNAWQKLDTQAYLNQYSKDFTSDSGQNLTRWAQQKSSVNVSKQWARIDVTDMSLFVGGKDDTLVATFDQDYRSNNLENRMRKRLYWRNDGGNYKIVWEGTASNG